VMAGVLIVIWAILFFKFNTIGIVHILLVFAGLILSTSIFFSKELTKIE